MIYSAKQLRNMQSPELETYKATLCLAALTAATYLDREGLHNQILRVNTILNEKGAGY
jgi:ribosomal protein L29